METSKGQKKVKDDLVSVDFSWEVQNFSKLNNFKHYSDVFAINDYKWQILLYPRGNNVDFLSVYLVVAESSKLPPGWSRYAAFSLTLVNQLHPSNSKTLALGRLLHFMKMKKVKDMTDDACEQLKLLWEELEAFKFYLAWLAPSVQRALDMNKIVESAGKLKRLRKDVDALQTQMKRLRTELAVAKANLEASVRDLNKTEEGLDEIDINGELRYGVSLI